MDNKVAVRIITAKDKHDWHIDLVDLGDRPKLMANHFDGNPERSSFFGDKHHIARLMMSYPHMIIRYGDAHWTEEGLEYMQGLFCPTLQAPTDVYLNQCPRLIFEVQV